MRDKFLVLVIPIIDNTDIAEMWKVFLILCLELHKNVYILL